MTDFNVNVPTQIDNNLTPSTTQGASKTAINIGLSTVQSVAASDATTKANAALATAQTYADGKVAQTITNGVTTSAPSQDAVFDALALKENSANKVGTIAASATDYPNNNAVIAYAQQKNIVSSPFIVTSVINHTGTTSEAVVYTSSPDLVGKLISGDVLMWAGSIQANNNANSKTLFFYISDSPTSKVNEVLIGTVTVSTAAANTVAFDKIMSMTSLTTQNTIASTGLSVVTGPNMATTSIDFGVGAKYFLVTAQTPTSAADNIKIQFARSNINRLMS